MIKRRLKSMLPPALLSVWRKYRSRKERQRLRQLRADVINYLAHIPPPEITAEQQAIMQYLKSHPSFPAFPYPFADNYKAGGRITVYRDREKKMRYVLQDGKRLYFRNDWDEYNIKAGYVGLLAEQDTASPHRYETAGFHVCEGDTVVDAGVAEGNFALSVIEKVKKIYLFEADTAWIAALEATFAPWREKVVIVNKYVSDKDTDNSITLDTFFASRRPDFIKADIEGAEPLLVAGATRLLSAPAPLKVVLCTYHAQNDAATLRQMLSQRGFRTEFSEGYMLFAYDRYLAPPYLRRALIRAAK
ncbi:MAG: FkbM family methyltransferase [Prevotellaceae bacterium]|jgi:hypothetical protein|nr:FkbM family methyltransferase [Prevotellaceae bacterium]